MINPFNATLYFSMIVNTMGLDSHYLNETPYEPHTLNITITNEDMYDLDDLIEKIFMQEEE